MDRAAVSEYFTSAVTTGHPRGIVAPQQAPLRSRPHRRGRHAAAGQCAAVRVVVLSLSLRRATRSSIARPSVRRRSQRRRSLVGSGDEIVAFRCTSRAGVVYHNVDRVTARGNILALGAAACPSGSAGVPLELEARMETRSILYRTLLAVRRLHSLAVAAMFAFIIWRVREAKRAAPCQPRTQVDGDPRASDLSARGQRT